MGTRTGAACAVPDAASTPALIDPPPQSTESVRTRASSDAAGPGTAEADAGGPGAAEPDAAGPGRSSDGALMLAP
ncbi:hypothetical protein Slu03_10640 [Sediminihabitans luteus]|nr:hypothetical protein Slu03_10640 [Sediminihabitans luteus]